MRGEVRKNLAQTLWEMQSEPKLDRDDNELVNKPKYKSK
ncbi:hypothetical protein VIDI103191_08475 [Vibrio diazotrophicus]